MLSRKMTISSNLKKKTSYLIQKKGFDAVWRWVYSLKEHKQTNSSCNGVRMYVYLWLKKRHIYTWMNLDFILSYEGIHYHFPYKKLCISLDQCVVMIDCWFIKHGLTLRVLIDGGPSTQYNNSNHYFIELKESY